MAKALLIALTLLAVSAAAQSHENAHPDCTRRLLQQKAIEHGSSTDDGGGRVQVGAERSVEPRAKTGSTVAKLDENTMQCSAIL